MRLNRNAERRRRCHARQQQLDDAAEAICSTDSECEVQTLVSLKQREDLIFVQQRESRVLQQREVSVKHETRILMAPKCEATLCLSQNVIVAFQLNATAAFQINVRFTF